MPLSGFSQFASAGPHCLPPQGEASDRTVAEAVCNLANHVAMDNRWVAALASSSLLAAGLDAAARLSSSNQSGDAELVSAAHSRCGKSLTAAWSGLRS